MKCRKYMAANTLALILYSKQIGSISRLTAPIQFTSRSLNMQNVSVQFKLNDRVFHMCFLLQIRIQSQQKKNINSKLNWTCTNWQLEWLYRTLDCDMHMHKSKWKLPTSSSIICFAPMSLLYACHPHTPHNHKAEFINLNTYIYIRWLEAKETMWLELCNNLYGTIVT